MLALGPAAARANVTPKIVHGSNASASEFPFQALLYTAGGTPVSSGPNDGGDRFCGGVVLDTTHVITAAHCVYNVFRASQVSSPDDVDVLVGTDDLTTMTGAQTRTASALAFDPRYDPKTNVHDIAVVTLSSPLAPTSTVAPIDILDGPTFDALPASTPLVVSGWGDMSPEPGDGSGPTFSNTLQEVSVPLVDNDTCVSDYAAGGVTVDPSLLFCAGDGLDPNTVPDSCQGDSGGPIVYDTDPSPTKAYELVGLVDSGVGCAQQTFPGIYTRITAADVKDFLSPLPPPAPSQTSPTTISGGNTPGQTLTCDPGTWNGDGVSFSYQFFRLSTGTALTNPGPPNTYTIQASDLGTRIVCEVQATNTGGFGFADSASVLVPVPSPPPPPIPVAKDTTAPKLRINSKKCTKASCTVKVKVTDPGTPSSGVARVKATLSYTRKVTCRKHGRRSTCTKRVHRALRAKAGTGGVFTIVAKRLSPGKGYTITLLPFDKAGNRPQFSTVTNVRTKPRHPHGLF